MQSANFPGKAPPSIAFFLITRSLAFLAASLALAAVAAFSRIDFASPGLSSKYSDNCCVIREVTADSISGLPSFALV